MDTSTRVEIMRAGHLGRWAALAGAALLASACSPQATGVAGVSAQSPATPSASASPSVTATIPPQTPPSQNSTADPQSAETPPKGEDPVKIPPPKLSKYTYAFPVEGCRTTYQRQLLVLPKTTIWAAKGCAFVAPVDGVVDEVNTLNKWSPTTDVGADREGRFVTIIGDDGVRYLGGHLDAVADGLKPGVRVKAGQMLGRIGNSGNARDTGTNLYFAISWKTGPAYWWVRRGMVNPWDYLDAWQSGNKTFSPKKETLKLRGRLGETPRCAVQCASKTVTEPKKKKKKKTRVKPTPTPIIINPT
ncbi:M23 family metallopeptidase [Nonomuraea aurantiaca]|uniref:M23 family metallopeptidase n=1 Tax=Nonomuraea aurantiaca TaxID=2878562 RepID=UPI001CD939D0|nr:M23 family metallopeptidase [Nonomuraea aurantiaca]MCA2221744.1 peptidoglycan DD-metalloendopeptidase family protein [Nonomuraea aurantiaca]